MSKIISYLKDENGASAAEYALILAIIGAAIALAMVFLSGQVGTAINRTGNCISSNGLTCS
jgi:pilus assembly protein Flp/PilA